jgi:hypothetical protein
MLEDSEIEEISERIKNPMEETERIKNERTY